MGLKCMKSITTTLSWTWTFPLLLVTLLFAFKRHRTNHVESKKLSKEKDPVEKTLVDLIGNTPVILIPSLSEATGCKIWGKAEFMNPGGSSKDRIALSILRSAESSGQLQKGGKVFEGTVGSTGLSLVMLCNALGYECHLVVPNDVAQEKLELLNVMGAKTV
ncbi:hypothetical protein HMI55_002876 [Coelomomyces lativittatus]|nr:hypothetical protein HMI55_002876 [Coelomomyces lativittatus]